MALCVAACLMVCAGSAGAIDIEPGVINVRQGRVEVAVRVSDLFPPRVEESLVRGMASVPLLEASIVLSYPGHVIDTEVPWLR